MTGRDRPRIHWVCPLPPARTDIAEYTRRILPELAARADLVLWTDAETVSPEIAALAPVRRFDPDRICPLDLREAGPGNGTDEAVFFHVGNAAVFHAGIIAAAQRCPGIVVLHDLALYECLRDLVVLGRLEREVLRNTAHGMGAPALAAVDALLEGRVVPGLPPLFQVVTARAVSVLTHTPGAFDALATDRSVPVRWRELSYAITPVPADRPLPTGPLRLVQFGHIGPNRRLEPIIDALGQLRGEVDFVFDIFGALWDPPRIAAHAAARGIADRVRIRGFVPEAELDTALRQADLVFNLRQPTMGEASGSQLRIWNAAALSIVTDLGWYATLPNDTVVKAPPRDETGAVVLLLRRLARDRSLARRIGAGGRARLEQRHSADRYADAIVALARESAADARTRLTVDALARAVATATVPALVHQRLLAAFR